MSMSSAYAGQVLAEGPGLARNDHGDTAKEAAALISIHANTQRANILRMFLALQVPCTCECLVNATGMPGNSVRPRLKELERDNFARKTGEHGMTSAGRKAELWTITETGRKAIEYIDRGA